MTFIAPWPAERRQRRSAVRPTQVAFQRGEKVQNPMFRAALLVTSLAVGCSDDSGPSGPLSSTLPETVQGIVSAASPTCDGNDDTYGTVRFPCERFQVVPPRRGTLVARLTWPDRNTVLRLGSGSNAFFQWTDCTSSGCESRIPVGTREASLAVGLDNRRSGSSSQAFEVNLSLE